MTNDTSKPNRGLRIALVLSLALNLAVAGLVAGAYFSGGHKGGAQRFDLSVGPLTRAMDSESREAVRDALRDSGAFQMRDRRAIRADMDLLVQTLRAETFDEAAFRDAVTRQRRRLEEGQNAVLDAVSSQIKTLSQQERADFADRLESQMRRNGPRSE